MKTQSRATLVLACVAVVFLLLAGCFLVNLWGRVPALREIPLVDPEFINPATARMSIADQIADGADPDDWDCYICHEEDTPPPLHFDEEHNVIVAEEHEDIVMGHGRHNRNNNCFNCHDEKNLLLLQTRDGHELALTNCPPLCGSCHGPVYRDWVGGAHGRTGGYWDESRGQRTRRICVACHDPHHPKFPSREPAPGPHPLHAVRKGEASEVKGH